MFKAKFLIPRNVYNQNAKNLSKGTKPSKILEKNPEVSSSQKTTNENNFVPFWDRIEKSRDIAKRSVIVQVKSKESADDLLLYCDKHFATPKCLHFHHNANNDDFNNFYVVEFHSKEIVNEIVKKTGRHFNKNCLPVCSPFLWFNGALEDKDMSNPELVSQRLKKMRNNVLIDTKSTTFFSICQELDDRLLSIDTLSEQITELFTVTYTNPLSWKLRFLASEQVFQSLSGLFPRCKVTPFGSSVNSFGKLTSDLDMVIQMDANEEENVESRLMFHSKRMPSQQSNFILTHLAFALKNMLPGCQNVFHVQHARIPIVKYRQDFLNLDCDLSCGNSLGIEASELLYLWGHVDKRVRPLVFVVRRWAAEHGLVPEERPTTRFTNFPLTLMVIFFLQNTYQILPSLEKLKKLGHETKPDASSTLNILRDLNGWHYALNKSYDDQKIADLSLEDLFFQFLEYYMKFDFSKHAVCVVSGRKVARRTHCIDVINPLEPQLNSASFVKAETVLAFQSFCNKTLLKFEKPEEMKKNQSKLMFLLHPGQDKLTDNKKFHQFFKSNRDRKKLAMPSMRDLLMD